MAGTEAVARILMPAETTDETYVSWSELTGMPVSGVTYWSELEACSKSAREATPPQGYVDGQTAARLVSVLARHTAPNSEFVVALSRVYCNDKIPRLPPPLALSGPESQFVVRQYADLYRCPSLTWVQDLTRDRDCHFPVAIWPVDLSWSLAAPLYSDSWYFSGSHSLYAALVREGLEAHPVSRHDPVTAEGD
jgi:hypothetical protein